MFIRCLRRICYFILFCQIGVIFGKDSDTLLFEKPSKKGWFSYRGSQNNIRDFESSGENFCGKEIRLKELPDVSDPLEFLDKGYFFVESESQPTSYLWKEKGEVYLTRLEKVYISDNINSERKIQALAYIKSKNKAQVEVSEGITEWEETDGIYEYRKEKRVVLAHVVRDNTESCLSDTISIKEITYQWSNEDIDDIFYHFEYSSFIQEFNFSSIEFTNDQKQRLYEIYEKRNLKGIHLSLKINDSLDGGGLYTIKCNGGEMECEFIPENEMGNNSNPFFRLFVPRKGDLLRERNSNQILFKYLKPIEIAQKKFLRWEFVTQPYDCYHVRVSTARVYLSYSRGHWILNNEPINIELRKKVI